jgi:hypothetical protein
VSKTPATLSFRVGEQAQNACEAASSKKAVKSSSKKRNMQTIVI